MNLLDVGLIAVSAGMIASAARRGFTRSGLGTLFCWSGLLAACWFYPLPAYFLAHWARPKVASLYGFLVIFGMFAIAGAVIEFAAGKWVTRKQLGWLDHPIGAVFGLVNAVVMCTLIVVALSLQVGTRQTQLVGNSYFAPPLTRLALATGSLLPQELRDQLDDRYQDARHALPVKLRPELPSPLPPDI